MAKSYIYKPELNQFKCKALARCLTHCLSCDEIQLTEEEQRVVITFCNSANERDFVESALQRLERKEQKTQDELFEQVMEQVHKNIPKISPPKPTE